MLARDLSLMGSAATAWGAALEDQLLETVQENKEGKTPYWDKGMI